MINRSEDKSQLLLTESAKIYRQQPRCWQVRNAGRTAGGFLLLLSSLVNRDLHKPSGLRQTLRPLNQRNSFKGGEL